tara:strand:- start:2053 stop:2343 length:291 start_codon:yes stop_codon:yes gene_type:complete
MVIKIDENLKTAAKLLSGNREKEYGNKKENHENIANLWSAYLHRNISAHDVAVLMLLLKVARTQLGSTSADTYIDMVGYAAIAGELNENNKEHGNK